jgi:hypothetical protein
MTLYLIAKLGHFLGIAMGVGGAIASDVLFMRSIKDKKISKDEIGLLEKLSLVLWGGLVLFIVSGLTFFYVQYVEKGSIVYLSSQPFLAKLTIFIILFLNAFVFHLYIFPKLRHAHTKGQYKEAIKKFSTRISVVGSISIVSWMYILILGTFRSITPKYFVYWEVMAMYLVLLVCGVVFSKVILTRDLKK